MENIFDIFKKIEKERASGVSEPILYIVAGLGNPGDKYHFNHHNMGFLALDCIEQKLGIKLDRSKFRSLCTDTVVAGKKSTVYASANIHESVGGSNFGSRAIL